MRVELTIMSFLAAITCFGQAGPDTISVPATLYDLSRQESDLGLQRADGIEAVTVFAPSDSTDHFCNGVCIAGFKGKLYCMWQSSKDAEDSPDTWTAFARSTDDGRTWSEPMVLAESPEKGIATSGGWYTDGRRLVAYINVWNEGHKEGHVEYRTSRDGIRWSKAKPVLMSDGTPMAAVFEQDPHRLPGGRIVNAAHFSPGLQAFPIWTDDKTGRTGWHKAAFEPTANGAQSRELEPSLFVRKDGSLVMIFRDQKSSYHKLAATSHDNGETWTNSFLTDIPDSRSKQCAGNLPDGTAFFVSNPVENKMRYPLVITLSDDGYDFDNAFLLRSYTELPEIRYNGSVKRKGYSYPKACVIGDWLYVSYSVNKERAEYVRIPSSVGKQH